MMALLKSESERASALLQLRCTENLREDEIVNAIRNVHGDKWENELNARLDVAIFSQVNSLGALPIILGILAAAPGHIEPGAVARLLESLQARGGRVGQLERRGAPV